MSLPPHLAYSCRKWAYQCDRPGRQPRQVIRLAKSAKTHTKSSKAVKNNVNIIFNDDTEAGKEWSTRELDVNSTSDKSELAVVVGEMLPSIPDIGPRRIPKRLSEFDEQRHCVVSTQDSRIVVFKLSDQRGNFHGLCNKQDGLCDTLLLPQHQQDQIVFYSEWVTLQSNVAKESFTHWKKQASLFRSEYAASRGFHDVNEVANNGELEPPAKRGALPEDDEILVNPISRREIFNEEEAGEVTKACKTLAIVEAHIAEYEDIHRGIKEVQDLGWRTLGGSTISGPTRSESDLRSIIDLAAEAGDIDKVRLAIAELVRILYLGVDAKIGRISGMVERMSDRSKRVREELTRPRGAMGDDDDSTNSESDVDMQG
ncbi:hypothetical protein F4782DRAFT_525197 [Xylaria castorea]|nr:hypothetical protein F4782DRAFT_525197 [Xylaria castorea]